MINITDNPCLLKKKLIMWHFNIKRVLKVTIKKIDLSIPLV